MRAAYEKTGKIFPVWWTPASDTRQDPMCAAGLGSVIGVTMLNIEIRDKGGGPIDVKTLRDFFKILNPPRH
jgi:hypothetical protein